MDAAQLIIEGKGYLGIEFGSTRIKAVLVDKSGNVLSLHDALPISGKTVMKMVSGPIL